MRHRSDSTELSRATLRVNRPVVKAKENTIRVYQEGELWHCDIQRNGERYGGVRHSKGDIDAYAQRELKVSRERGIFLKHIS